MLLLIVNGVCKLLDCVVVTIRRHNIMIYLKFKGKPDVTKLERTIMVVGATGAGKSTLIDGMINYIMDVSWDSDFRFSLVDLTAEENSKLKDQVCLPFLNKTYGTKL